MDSVKVDDLNNILDAELDNAVIWNGSHLVEAIFPDQHLPFTVDENLLHSLTTVYSNNLWITLPKLHQEPAYATWMNEIGDALQKHTSHPCLRFWDVTYHSTPLSGFPIKCKPDIMLLDTSNSDSNRKTARWPHVRAVCEITTDTTFRNHIRYTIVSKAFIMMNCQFNRRFIPSLSIIGDQFLVTACDRAGVINSIQYHLHRDALVLLRILVGFMFGDNYLIGHDPSMRQNDSDEIIGITVDGQEYHVVRNLFFSPSLRGRATQCWHVKCGVQEYIIKDCWIQTGRKHSEIAMLGRIKGVSCVPTIICGEDLQLPNLGGPDSTNVICVGEAVSEERVHRRILMTPVGESILSFTSKKELIGGFIDIIEAHKTLCNEKHVLHRDISYNNLMLWDDPSLGSPKRCRGLLIDFDYASLLVDKKGDPGNFSIGEHTGTGPFMAFAVLNEADTQQIIQKPAHDLESIFYVLLYICTTFAGPRGRRRAEEELDELSSMPIEHWFKHVSRFKDLADIKFSHLDNFEQRFQPKIASHFKDLWPLLVNFWNVLFPAPLGSRPDRSRASLMNCMATHDTVLEVFRESYANLPEPDPILTWAPRSPSHQKRHPPSSSDISLPSKRLRSVVNPTDALLTSLRVYNATNLKGSVLATVVTE